MKRIYIYLMVMATLLIGGGKAMAQSVTIDGVAYTVSGDHAYVSGNSGIGDTVVVHGSVTIDEVEYPVTEIGYRAFYRTTHVLAYTLPDGIVSIGTEAFYDNYELKTINLPSTVESIGHMAFGYNWDVQITELPANLKTLDTEAFRGCQSATFTKIPDGITHIPNGAFRGCYSLTSLDLPKGLTQIDDYAFEGCTALKRIINHSDLQLTQGGTDNGYVAYYAQQIIRVDTIIDGFWFDTDANGKHHLTYYDGSDSILVLPSDYEGENYSIDEAVFSGHHEIVSIQLPESVDSIGARAFSGCSSLTSINIPSGISSISNATFEGCYVLTSLTLPESVDSIGARAFSGCSSLTSVNIPSGVTSIGEYTFYGCAALDSLSLPETVTSIGTYAFYNCSSLTSVNIPSGVPSIGDNTFYGCSALTSLTLPETVTSIGTRAFYGCSSLTSVNIPSGVPTIGEYTFYDCAALDSLALPETVTSIGVYAFHGCSALTAMTIPANVTSIGNCVFLGCTGLNELTFADGGKTLSLGYNSSESGLFTPCKLEKLYLGRNLSYSTTYSPFYNNDRLKEVVIGDSVTSIASYAFSNCDSITTITLPQSVTTVSAYAFLYCSSLSSISLPDSLTSIGVNAFRNCGKLATLTLPKSLTSIGNYAFQDCRKLKKIINYSDLQLSIGSTDYGYVAAYAQQIINVDTIIDGYWFDTDSNGKHHLTNYEGTDSVLVLPSDYQGENYCIDGSAFSGHREIVSIQIPETVDSIGVRAFDNCSSLTSVNIPSGVPAIGGYTFSGCSSLTSLTLPETVTSIGTYAFQNCSSLTSVNIPSGVPAIGGYTFSGCSSLTSLTLPETVTSIGTYAFQNCSSLTSVNIPSGVPTIGEYTFYNCSSLTSLTIPASVTSLGSNSFYGCTSLKELTFVDGGETLSLERNSSATANYNYGLFNCSSLEKLYLGRNLSFSTNENYVPFKDQIALTEVVVGDSVTSLPQYMFYNCTSLVSIQLPNSLTSIGSATFYNCASLTHVYCGSESPEALRGSNLRTQAVIYVPEGTYVPYKELFPNNIIVDGSIKEVTVHVDIPGTLGEEVLNQVPYIRNVNSLKVSGTLNNDDISTITGSMVNLLHLDLSKTSLTSVNGIGHANLCSIVFPDSCKSLSGYRERDNLTSIILPDAVETLGDNCFYGCDQLTEVTMPANLKTVGAYAFQYCRKLKEITFKDGLVLVGNEAFYDCSNLKSVFFGAGDKTIGHQAFWNCNSLESVSFGDGVASITGSHPFYSCDKLRILIVGDGISTFTNDSNYPAFRECYNISEIHIPNIEAWLNSSFSNIQSTPNYVSSNVNLYIDGELLTDVVIPSSVTSIRPYAFGNIKGITSVTIPESVKTISSEAFYDCDNLTSVVIPEGVTTIQGNAFAECDSLRSITLPSTLNNCAAGAFIGSGLEEVTCPAFFPPVTGGDMIGANNCTLYVPEWTLNRYKLANNWNLFAAIEPISGIYPSTISVYTEEGLTIPAEGLAEGYIPNLELVRYDASNVGRLTLRGEKAMPLATFTMEQTRDAGTMTSLVNYGTLTADSVATELTISANTWHYLSFPYDVKIADIATLGDWVIRRYDGASRARADFSSTWQNVPYDSILHAGEGYIWYSTNGNFTVPALENDNRNLIFANEARYTQLKEHASATVANYGWNLIGNPYPCFYDTRFMEFSSPITVRSGNSYAAYSPLDDSYILSPLEAFFVQCSADNNVVGFTAEGRQTDNTVRALTSAPQRARAANSERKVFNLYLESDSYADHTRFVINEKASLAYEISCDAAKFMSDDPAVQQLFTIEGGEHMAINERPMANGEVMLGAYFGKGGSYTIALDTRATEMEVVLIDRYTGAETDLLTGSYMFTTEVGMFTDRFAIGMKRTGDVTAIETPAAQLEVVAVEGAISIRNAAAPVHIYNAAGALVATEHGQEVTVEVAPGIYVVKVGNAAHKVSVIK